MLPIIWMQIIFEDNDLIDDINDVNTKDDNELLEHALSELMPENDLIQEEVTTSTEFEDVGRINEELDMSDLMTIKQSISRAI